MNEKSSLLALGCMTKLTRADRFREEMNRVVPWADLVAVVQPHWGDGPDRPA